MSLSLLTVLPLFLGGSSDLRLNHRLVRFQRNLATKHRFEQPGRAKLKLFTCYHLALESKLPKRRSWGALTYCRHARFIF